MVYLSQPGTTFPVFRLFWEAFGGDFAAKTAWHGRRLIGEARNRLGSGAIATVSEASGPTRANQKTQRQENPGEVSASVKLVASGYSTSTRFKSTDVPAIAPWANAQEKFQRARSEPVQAEVRSG